MLLPGLIREKSPFFLLTGRFWPFLAIFGGFRGGSKKGYFWPFLAFFGGGGGPPPSRGGSGGGSGGVRGGPVDSGIFVVK